MRQAILVVGVDHSLRKELVCMLEAVNCIAIPISNYAYALDAIRDVIFKAVITMPKENDLPAAAFISKAKIVQPEILVVSISKESMPIQLASLCDAHLRAPLTTEAVAEIFAPPSTQTPDAGGTQ